MKIKTGDNVKVLNGKDKGKVGVVIQVFPERQLVVVDGINMAVKHLKGNSQQKGKKVDYSAPLHVSNVAIVGKDDKSGRIGVETKTIDGKTAKYRVISKAGKRTRVE